MSPNSRQVSGLYVVDIPILGPTGILPATPNEDPWNSDLVNDAPWRDRPQGRMELRLDVDGPNPQNWASIAVQSPRGKAHLVASLAKNSGQSWHGTVIYYRGESAYNLFSEIKITVTPPDFRGKQQAKLSLLGLLANELQFVLAYRSAYFREVEMEVDYTEAGKEAMVLDILPASIPGGYPADLPTPFTLENAYQRAGVRVTRTVAEGASDAGMVQTGSDTTENYWDDDELDNALEEFWSAKSVLPKWSMWSFYANEYWDSLTFGLMFDAKTDPQRQGCAIFRQLFDDLYNQGAVIPTSEEAKNWKKRSQFFVGVHEMAHTFNLSHPDSHATNTGWFPFPNDETAPTFTNYPWGLNTPLSNFIDALQNEKQFYTTFPWQFTDEELRFIRHAPEEFVQMGREWWEPPVGDSSAALSNAAEGLELKLQLGRSKPVFSFLEPIYLDVILQSHEKEPRFLNPELLCGADQPTLTVQKDGGEERHHLPLVRRMQFPAPVALGKPLAASVLVSADRTGWLLDEPGIYTIRARLNVHGSQVVSEPLRLRILGPRNQREDAIALDYFTDVMGRILTFRGSHADSARNGMDVLRTIVADPELEGSPVVDHAKFVLARVRATGFKELKFERQIRDSTRGDIKRRIVHHKPEAPEDGPKELAVLLQEARNPEAFGYVEYARRCFWWSRRLRQDIVHPLTNPVIEHLRRVMSAPHLSPILAAVEGHWYPPALADSATSG